MKGVKKGERAEQGEFEENAFYCQTTTRRNIFNEIKNVNVSLFSFLTFFSAFSLQLDVGITMHFF